MLFCCNVKHTERRSLFTWVNNMTAGDASGHAVLAELAGQHQVGARTRDGGGWSLQGCAAAARPGQSCYSPALLSYHSLLDHNCMLEMDSLIDWICCQYLSHRKPADEVS